jgi:GAF domain-containing protein
MRDDSSNGPAELEAIRMRALRAVGDGAPLREVLNELILALEARSVEPMRASVLLLDEEGRRLTHGAAPSLSQAYCEAIDGVEIGPAVGSCGAAAFYGEAVFVTDIKRDPLWADFADLALADGLRSCWSMPIKDGQGKVLGTFANYYLQARNPRPHDVAAMESVAGAVAEAILRYRAGGPA